VVTLDAATEASITGLANAFVAETGVPGAIVGVRAPDGDELAVAVGIDDVETGTLLGTDRVFRIGSVTKALVAATLFAEVMDGSLSLDDQLGEAVPEATNPGATLAQVLAHDAGLANWDALEGGSIQGPLIGRLGQTWTTDEVVDLVGGLPPVGAPGQGFAYSNPGYQLLTAVLERTTGTPVGTLVDEQLTRPLGLADTVFGPLPAPPDRLVHGWGDLGGTQLDNQDLPAASIDSLFTGTGAGYSDVDDLLRFGEAFWSSEQALAPEGVDAGEPVTEGYGLATQFMVDDELAPGVELLGHTGDIFGARTVVGHDRASGVTVVVHVNSNQVAREPTVDLALEVVAAVLQPT
jgi:CubicO group peptidase (beta-lactamase class C family)